MKNNRYLMMLSFFVLAMFIGCTDMMDVHSEFIKDGETIYSVKVDSTFAHPGNNRIKLEGYLKNGSQVQKIVVKYKDLENNEHIEEFPYDYNQSPDMFIAEFQIAEGQYLFEITSENEQGNSSITAQVDAKVYGEKYRSFLANRGIQEIEKSSGGGAILTFASAAENETGTRFDYQTPAGESKQVILPPSQAELKVDDIDLLVPVSYSSGYLPEPNAIDTFFADTNELDLTYLTINTTPIFDKSTWEVIDFSSEMDPESEGGGNGRAASIIDGDINSYWQSEWAPNTAEIPHHITIDMKTASNVKVIELYRRPGNNHTKTVELEGSIDGSAWEDLGTINYSDNGAEQLGTLEIAGGKNLRYIKINVIESNAPPYVSLGELNVIVDFNKEAWEIIDFSSEMDPASEGGGNGRAAAIIDGDNNSYWQSEWAPNTAEIPHHITIDMNGEFNVSKLKIELFRRAGNNHTKTVVLEWSLDGSTWNELGTLNYSGDGGVQSEMLEVTETKYLRFVKINVTDSNAPPYVSLGEIYMSGTL